MRLNVSNTWRIILFGALFLLTGLSAQTIMAQPEATGWTKPRRVPGYGDESGTPHMIVDQNRTVHGFSSQQMGEKVVITYNQWTLAESWSTPIDIILPPAKNQARFGEVVLDAAGKFHVNFFSGDDLSANIYYSYAYAVNAGNAQAWSAPVVIGREAITPSEMMLAGNDDGVLVNIYSGKAEGVGLYTNVSQDDGRSWSRPEPIFLTYNNEVKPASLISYRDSAGILHVMWGVVDTTGNSQALYYSRFDFDSLTWSEPIEFAKAIGFEADTPAFIEYGDELFIVYHNNFPTTRWMQRSSDGGVTWTEPVRLFSQVGSNGAASFVLDKNNTLHMFFGNRIGNPPKKNMWHSIWDGETWREPEKIVVKEGPSGRDPSFANAVLVQGNLILLTWRTDPGQGPNGVWYTYKQIDAEEDPIALLPTPPPAENVITNLGTAGDAAPTAVPTPSFELTRSTEGFSQSQTYVVGTIPAIFLVIVVVSVVGFRLQKKK